MSYARRFGLFAGEFTEIKLNRINHASVPQPQKRRSKGDIYTDKETAKGKHLVWSVSYD